MPDACPPPDDLAAFHRGDLSAAAIDRVTAHLETCPACEASLHELEGKTGPLADAFRDLPADRPLGGAGPGTVIGGRYKLLEPLGEGGMGAVWMAQQTDPVKRVVAVKMIKPGMDSKAVLARFEAERQALALMDHPNIAKVFDAGAAADGRPYFVMELVKGVPITAFCDARKLTPRARLELFVPVCRAVQHAHQKGVIHRDIKPSNVMVALYDGKPVPKVIDFGVAKATGQPLTDKTLVTGFGAVVGTPEYMAPEQAELNQLDVDTRADVFALGVLLYELLTGGTPLTRQRLGTAALLEVLRLVREEEPPLPSTRLSTADALPSIAANRGTEPRRLTALMRGELDWVVMKALDKDRARRYETVNALARDVERYLADEPVEAGRPTLRYRLRKFARKHRRPLAAAARLYGEVADARLAYPGLDYVVTQDIVAKLASRRPFRATPRRPKRCTTNCSPPSGGGWRRAATPRSSRRWGGVLLGLGQTRFTQRKYPDAVGPLKGAVDALPDGAADPYPAIQARTGLGECLMNLGRPAEAKPYLQAAYDMRRKAVDTLPAVKVNALSIARLAEAIDLLVRVCEATGDAAEAAKWRTERAKYLPDPAPAPRPVKRPTPR